MSRLLRRRVILGAASALVWTRAALAQSTTISDGFYAVAPGPVQSRGGGVEYLLSEPLMAFDEIAEITVEHQRPRTGFFVVALRLTGDGREHFSALTADHIGERIAIVLGGEVVTAPVIYERIDGGKLQIDGASSREEAQALASRLRRDR